MTRPLILDISFWQDNPDTKDIIVDFNKMRLNASGVILRIGQGNWEDKKFYEYWTNANGKLPIGGYWYYDNSYDPEKQAELCVSILKKYNVNFSLPLFADFEDRKTAPFSNWKNWYKFIERLKLRIPEIKIGIYTGYYYWLEFCPLRQEERDYFGKYDLWIAQYPYDSHLEEFSYTKPTIPTNTWDNWVLWQVSDRGDGHFFGVESSRVDINYFNGTQKEFEKYFGKTTESISEVIPPILNKKYFIVTYENKKVILK